MLSASHNDIGNHKSRTEIFDRAKARFYLNLTVRERMDNLLAILNAIILPLLV